VNKYFSHELSHLLVLFEQLLDFVSLMFFFVRLLSLQLYRSVSYFSQVVLNFQWILRASTS
jgi:hypothetical protein